jgi:hypothetical protein
MTFLQRLLGGRPMKYLGCAFIDTVSGAEVNLYRDTIGRHWLAESRWALFRVRKEQPNG